MASVIVMAACTGATVSAQSAGPGLGYPYVKSGTNIIVHCDEGGSFYRSLLFSTRIVDYYSPIIAFDDVKAKKIPAQFEVKKMNQRFPSYFSESNCDSYSGWRLPTYNEALVIVLLNAELKDRITGVIPTVTVPSISESTSIYRVYLYSDGSFLSSIDDRSSLQADSYVCIRDIDTSSLGFSDL